ncbi:MAG: SDR family NAD(P)-dependent oxidoreductase [Nonomuraea sp.]|nr:SDR family NAD(P)-dependent oxidoreductase [Nonomuraea sp.]
MATILVTGATDGLGRELARRLAARGDHVIAHGRNPERVRQAPGEHVLADLSDLRAVDAMADELLSRHDRIDVLVNNAGIGAGTPDSGRELNADGVELRFAVNYLAGYHLTRRLLPVLAGAVVNVASAGQQAVDFADPMMERGYTRMRAYAQSKLSQIMFTFDLAEELAGRGVRVNALHPATFMDTVMVRQAGIAPTSTVAQGADATMRLVDGAQGVTGRYFDGTRDSRAAAQAYDPEARRRLRELSDSLVTGILGRPSPLS